MTNLTDHQFNIGCKTADRLKSASKIHGLDTRLSMQRFVCEEISRGLSKHLTVKHIIKGGMSVPQVIRETGDLDIVFTRQMTEAEIRRAFADMTPDLAKKGIHLESVGPAEELSMGGNLGLRFPILAWIGGSRVNTHLDETGGIQAFPYFKLNMSEGSVIFRDQEPLAGYYQTRTSLAADKLHAIICREDTSRWKDYVDASMIWDLRLSHAEIAQELVHRLKKDHDSDVELMSVLPEVPKQMGIDYAQGKEVIWRKWAAKHQKTPDDVIKILCEARQLYHQVRQEALRLQIPRRPRVARGGQANLIPPGFRERTMAARLKSKGNDVVDIDDYRDENPSYRPKF